MKTEVFDYNNASIKLLPEFRKGKMQYWIFINGDPLTFVAKRETAVRVACNFIDVVTGEDFKKTKTVYIPSQS